MLAQIPRLPIFPEHMINKQIKRIERDVEDEVIPVSAGIYSQHKLMQRLQAIPKPDIVNYEDPIFYEIVDVSRFPCKTSQCPLCKQQYGNKKHAAVQCYFCGIWNCQDCMCPRKRYHPRAKQSNSQRFTICFKCDDKFLSLTLHHNKSLLQQVLRRVRNQKNDYQRQCDKRQNDSNLIKNIISSNKFKISSLLKEKSDHQKNISKLKASKQEQEMKLKIRQKYLQILMRKKTKLAQLKLKQESKMVEQIKQKQIEPVYEVKPIRSLSQRNVLSESIKIEATTNIQKEDSIQQTTYTRMETLTYSPPEKPLDQRQIEHSKQAIKVNNFYNYAEWATNENKQTSPNLSNQNAFTQQQVLSPPPLILETPQNQNYIQEQITKSEWEIFPQNNEQTPKQQQQQQDELESLDGQVIKIRKAALMKAAFEQSRKSRFETMEQQLRVNTTPKKCQCQIY